MKKRETFTLDEELLNKLNKLSKDTMIPKARLVSQAIEKLLKEYESTSSAIK